jgi:hypothetical protein
MGDWKDDLPFVELPDGAFATTVEWTMTVENSNDVTLPNAFEKGDVLSILVQNLDEATSKSGG